MILQTVVVMIIIMIVIHLRDRNLVKNLRNQFVHPNVVQGLLGYFNKTFNNFPFHLVQKNAVDPDLLVIENIVHVLDHTIVIVERKTLVNTHVLVRVHVPKDVIIVVTVEKIKNLDDKPNIFFCFIYIFVYER
jgi:hypothetical protein